MGPQTPSLHYLYKKSTKNLFYASNVDPQHVDADPDPPFHFDAGPEPIIHFDTDPDPDPTLYSDADSDLDPAPNQIDTLRPLASRPSAALF